MNDTMKMTVRWNEKAGSNKPSSTDEVGANMLRRKGLMEKMSLELI